MMASAMASVGTWVGFVQPGSLSLVHVEVPRATRTLVASSIIVRLVEPTSIPLPAKWCIWRCCIVSRWFSSSANPGLVAIYARQA